MGVGKESAVPDEWQNTAKWTGGGTDERMARSEMTGMAYGKDRRAEKTGERMARGVVSSKGV